MLTHEYLWSQELGHRERMTRMLSTAGTSKLCKNLLNSSYLWGKNWQDNSYVYPFSQAILMLSFSTFASSVNTNASSRWAHRCLWHSNMASFCLENIGRKMWRWLSWGLNSVDHENRCLWLLVVLCQQWMLGDNDRGRCASAFFNKCIFILFVCYM